LGLNLFFIEFENIVVIVYLAYRLYSKLSLILPLNVSYWTATRIGDVVYLLMRKDRQERVKIIKRILEDKISQRQAQKIIRYNFQNFNKSLIDFFRIPKLDRENIDSLVEIVGQENLDTALKEGKGVILAGLHMGNGGFPLTALALKGFPVNIVVWKEKNEKVDRLFQSIRQSKGVRVIYSHNSARHILRLLKQNEIVAVTVDLNGGKKGIELNVWKRKMSIVRSPLVFAFKQKAPVLPGVIIRQPDNRHKIIIGKPIRMELTQNREKDLETGAMKLFEFFKKYIIEYPEQWHWLKFS